MEVSQEKNNLMSIPVLGRIVAYFFGDYDGSWLTWTKATQLM
jgi:hypothetical protein